MGVSAARCVNAVRRRQHRHRALRWGQRDPPARGKRRRDFSPPTHPDTTSRRNLINSKKATSLRRMRKQKGGVAYCWGRVTLWYVAGCHFVSRSRDAQPDDGKVSYPSDSMIRLELRVYFSGSTGARIFLHSCLDPDAAPDAPKIQHTNTQNSPQYR